MAVSLEPDVGTGCLVTTHMFHVALASQAALVDHVYATKKNNNHRGSIRSPAHCETDVVQNEAHLRRVCEVGAHCSMLSHKLSGWKPRWVLHHLAVMQKQILWGRGGLTCLMQPQQPTVDNT